MIELIHRRGDTFEYNFTLTEPWEGSTFDSVVFTVRDEIPASSVTNDDGAIEQASVDGGEITFSGADGTVEIPASRTTAWPAKKLYWDLEGRYPGSGEQKVKTLASGTLLVQPDFTRGQVDS